MNGRHWKKWMDSNSTEKNLNFQKKKKKCEPMKSMEN